MTVSSHWNISPMAVIDQSWLLIQCLCVCFWFQGTAVDWRSRSIGCQASRYYWSRSLQAPSYLEMLSFWKGFVRRGVADYLWKQTILCTEIIHKVVLNSCLFLEQASKSWILPTLILLSWDCKAVFLLYQAISHVLPFPHIWFFFNISHSFTTLLLM